MARSNEMLFGNTHRAKAWLGKTALAPLAIALASSAAVATTSAPAQAEPSPGGPTLQDYRWFRALSIDLQGRIPTRSEIASFEATGFDVDAWIDERLTGTAFADRLRRIYLDALRIELGESFNFVQQDNMLRRYAIDIAMADGTTKRTWMYYRTGQRRVGKRDKEYCFDTAETGQEYARNKAPIPEAPTKAVPIATVEARAVKVKPWWLYRDYASANPTQHYKDWSKNEPRFVLGLPKDAKGPSDELSKDARLLRDADGTPVDDVWVCKEEAQTTEIADVTIRDVPVTGVSCASESGATHSELCGCGPGLERCTPGAGPGADPNAFILSKLAPLGHEMPFESTRQEGTTWWRHTWNDEARMFFGMLFGEDHDFREVLTAKYDWVNGPAAQFYRGVIDGDCCNDLLGLGPIGTYARPAHVFDPARLPKDLLPTEMDRWVKVEDRGPEAAGVLTLPAFLAKFSSRRARANAVYNAFMCREFVAENLDLAPSEEPNLTIRPGCSTCHAKLEPLAAYFSRTKENGFSLVTAPIDNAYCAKAADGSMTPECMLHYDPAFSNGTAGKLRGAYASAENAAKGPAGFAQAVVASPDFATCAAKTITESFLGRRTSGADGPLLDAMTHSFQDGGYKMRALVRAVVKTNAYRHANTALEAGAKAQNGNGAGQ